MYKGKGARKEAWLRDEGEETCTNVREQGRRKGKEMKDICTKVREQGRR